MKIRFLTKRMGLFAGGVRVRSADYMKALLVVRVDSGGGDEWKRADGSVESAFYKGGCCDSRCQDESLEGNGIATVTDDTFDI